MLLILRATEFIYEPEVGIAGIYAYMRKWVKNLPGSYKTAVTASFYYYQYGNRVIRNFIAQLYIH